MSLECQAFFPSQGLLLSRLLYNFSFNRCVSVLENIYNYVQAFYQQSFVCGFTSNSSCHPSGDGIWKYFFSFEFSKPSFPHKFHHHHQLSIETSEISWCLYSKMTNFKNSSGWLDNICLPRMRFHYRHLKWWERWEEPFCGRGFQGDHITFPHLFKCLETHKIFKYL